MRVVGLQAALDLRKSSQIEHSIIEGKDLYFIYCIWVHGYKKGVGNHQKKGIGKALLQAAEEDAESKGAKGIAAWGLSMPSG